MTATVIKWNTHPESMENKNTLMTSDFPHAAREGVEKRYGGMAIYVSGDIGAVSGPCARESGPELQILIDSSQHYAASFHVAFDFHGLVSLVEISALIH